MFRQVKPFPLAYSHAKGTRKWTLDGQELVDFCMGHGSLIFGHNHPEIVEAIQAQLGRGSHFASICEVEVELGEHTCNADRMCDSQLVRRIGAER